MEAPRYALSTKIGSNNSPSVVSESTVDRRDQLEPSREDRARLRPRHRHDAVLERLPERLERGALELGQLVEQLDAPMRQCAGMSPGGRLPSMGGGEHLMSSDAALLRAWSLGIETGWTDVVMEEAERLLPILREAGYVEVDDEAHTWAFTDAGVKRAEEIDSTRTE